jgi:hypothetical protein
MNFADLEKRYRVLREDQEKGKITNEKFLEEAEKLSFRDEKGNAFRLDVQTGARMSWDGKQWNVIQQTPGQGLPGNTFMLLWKVITGFIKNIPKALPAILIRLGITAAIMFAINKLVWEVNWRVIAKGNEGIAKTNLRPPDPRYYLLNLNENKAAFEALCFMVFFVLSLFIGRMMSKGGPKAFFKGFDWCTGLGNKKC